MSGDTKNIFGILIRFADKLLSSGVKTIEEHNAIIRAKGRVFFGKVGRSIGRNNIAACNNILLERWLILVKRENRQYIFYKSPIASAQIDKPKDRDLIPKYYSDKNVISCWICVNHEFQRMSSNDVNHWVIKSSRGEIREALRSSFAGYFLITK